MRRGLAALLVLWLAGCAWHGTGTVVQKDYEPAYMNTWVETRCTSYGSADRPMQICIPVPHNDYVPQRWMLRVKDAQGDRHWVSVASSEYEQATIGGTFSNGEDG